MDLMRYLIFLIFSIIWMILSQLLDWYEKYGVKSFNNILCDCKT